MFQLTIENTQDTYVRKGQKHVHGSKIRQPFGLFSTTSGPDSMTFQGHKI